MNSSKLSRRGFLKQGGALGGMAAVGGLPIALNLSAIRDAAAATDPSDYKALVCVFLNGGNDAYNTVPYTDASPSWARYVEARTAPSGFLDVKLPAAEIRQLGLTSGPAIGLHPSLSNVQALFQQGRVAIIGNIGTLVEPIDQTSYSSRSAKQPPKLYSHNDQASIWQTGEPEGYRSGWGGSVALHGATGNQVEGAPDHLFTSISIETSPAFSSTLGSQGIAGFGASQNSGALKPGGQYGDKMYGHIDQSAWLRPVLNGAVGTSDGSGGAATHLIEQDYLTKSRTAVLAFDKMDASFKSFTWPAVPTALDRNNLAKQLHMVARIIRARASAPLSIRRQVFFVQLGGFDTHENQAPLHRNQLSILDQALGHFYTLLGDDVNRVTTFTASDFGRKLSQNKDGTDHGWGAHHFVIGGSQVAGGKVYGQFPDLSTWNASTRRYSDPQLLPDGTMIPKVSVDQLGYQLARWFGVPDDKLPVIFPHYWEPTGGVSMAVMG